MGQPPLQLPPMTVVGIAAPYLVLSRGLLLEGGLAPSIYGSFQKSAALDRDTISWNPSQADSHFGPCRISVPGSSWRQPIRQAWPERQDLQPCICRRTHGICKTYIYSYILYICTHVQIDLCIYVCTYV